MILLELLNLTLSQNFHKVWGEKIYYNKSKQLL